jgi:hypothetical protein
MAASRALPASDVFRARLILLLAEGRSYAAIKRDLHATAPAIARWKQRFLEKRSTGWWKIATRGAKPPSSRPSSRRGCWRPPSAPPKDCATH